MTIPTHRPSTSPTISSAAFSGLSSRLLDRLRQKEGLSYSAGSSLSMGSRQRLSSWTVAAMVAPQNAARAEQAFLEELRRAAATVSRPARGRRGQEGHCRSSVPSPARRTAQSPRAGYLSRPWPQLAVFPGLRSQADGGHPEQVSAAFRKYIDPEQLTLVIAGDTGKGLGN
jgi:zinc protease